MLRFQKLDRLVEFPLGGGRGRRETLAVMCLALCFRSGNSSHRLDCHVHAGDFLEVPFYRKTTHNAVAAKRPRKIKP